MADRRRWDYKICPLCGASLDVGEICDCTQKKPPAETAQERLLQRREKNTSRPQKRLEGALRRF